MIKYDWICWKSIILTAKCKSLGIGILQQPIGTYIIALFTTEFTEKQMYVDINSTWLMFNVLLVDDLRLAYLSLLSYL